VKNIPEQGDIVALSFDPQSGHEQTYIDKFGEVQ